MTNELQHESQPTTKVDPAPTPPPAQAPESQTQCCDPTGYKGLNTSIRDTDLALAIGLAAAFVVVCLQSVAAWADLGHPWTIVISGSLGAAAAYYARRLTLNRH